MNQNQKSELPLRRESGFGFVEQEQSIPSKLEIQQGKKGFPMGAGMKTASAVERGYGRPAPKFLIEFVDVRSQVEEAFRAQEKANPSSPVK